MSKTTEEILAPKPEARPRIYVYAIAEAAHAAAPTARPNSSPGQRPGYPIQNPNPALKGRPRTKNANVHAHPLITHWPALSGLEIIARRFSQGVALGWHRTRLWRLNSSPMRGFDHRARPRIYAYSMDDKARVAAPTARPNSSPGQRPGYPIQNPNPALKGRPRTTNANVHADPLTTHWPALSGLGIIAWRFSQGVALGWHSPPRWGCAHRDHPEPPS
jgi:hypothetical protein